MMASLAGSLGIQSEYRSFPTIRALLDAAANVDIEVAVTDGRKQGLMDAHCPNV